MAADFISFSTLISTSDHTLRAQRRANDDLGALKYLHRTKHDLGALKNPHRTKHDLGALKYFHREKDDLDALKYVNWDSIYFAASLIYDICYQDGSDVSLYGHVGNIRPLRN